MKRNVLSPSWRITQWPFSCKCLGTVYSIGTCVLVRLQFKDALYSCHWIFGAGTNGNFRDRSSTNPESMSYIRRNHLPLVSTNERNLKWKSIKTPRTDISGLNKPVFKGPKLLLIFTKRYFLVEYKTAVKVAVDMMQSNCLYS